MKSGGHFAGGIILGALIGVGIGYLIGVDSEKKQQWLRLLSDKVMGNGCWCDDSCDCEDDSAIDIEERVKQEDEK